MLTSGIEIISKRSVRRHPEEDEEGGSLRLFEDAIVFSGYESRLRRRGGGGGEPRPSSTNDDLSSNGLIGLSLNDGSERWRSGLLSKPSKHDCNLIDVDGDGVKDCLVVGQHGLMTAVNPINGKQ